MESGTSKYFHHIFHFHQIPLVRSSQVLSSRCQPTLPLSCSEVETPEPVMSAASLRSVYWKPWSSFMSMRIIPELKLRSFLSICPNLAFLEFFLRLQHQQMVTLCDCTAILATRSAVWERSADKAEVPLTQCHSDTLLPQEHSPHPQDNLYPPPQPS